MNVKTEPKNGFIPVINIWWPQTINDKNAIAINAPTMALYPKIGLREFTAITSDTMPRAGNKIIYTSGCPKNQKRCSNKIGDPPALCKTSPLIIISDK